MDSRDGGNGTGSASGDERDDDRGEDGGANPVDAGADKDSKLQRLSRQRQEIEAAIAAAMEENYNQDESPTSSSDRRTKDPKRPDSASRSRSTGTREEEEEASQKSYKKASHGRERPRRRQRQSSGTSGVPHREEGSFIPSGQHQDTLTRPIGKPPRAPSRPGDRSRQSSGATRRTLSVWEVDDPPDGTGGDGRYSNTESFAWGDEDCSEADEVRTEGSDGGGNGGNGGNGNGGGVDKDWRDNHLSDGEGSVWEAPFSFGGWDGDEDRSSPREGVGLPALTEIGEIYVRGAPSGDDPRRRQRHRVVGSQGNNQAGADSWRKDTVQAQAALRDGNGKEMDGSDVRERKHVAGGDLDEEGSCNSRWSLSVEDEVQERNGSENGFHVQRVHSGDGTRGEDALRGRSMSAEEKGPGFGARTNPTVDSGAAGRGTDDAAGGVPEYLEDVFEGSEREGQGNDVPFAVSSPR